MVYGNFGELPKEQLLINYYMIKNLIVLKTQIMTGIKADLLQWFIQFLIKRRLIKTEEQESVLG